MQTAHLMQSSATEVTYVGVEKRRKGRPVGVIAKGIRVKAWRTMRALSAQHPNFTLGDILDIVATGREKDAPSNLLKYMACLERHGIITRLTRRVPGVALTSPGAVIWRLSQDLGWYAPVWRQAQKVLWNPNAQAVVPMPAGQPDGSQA